MSGDYREHDDMKIITALLSTLAAALRDAWRRQLTTALDAGAAAITVGVLVGLSRGRKPHD